MKRRVLSGVLGPVMALCISLVACQQEAPPGDSVFLYFLQDSPEQVVLVIAPNTVIPAEASVFLRFESTSVLAGGLAAPDGSFQSEAISSAAEGDKLRITVVRGEDLILDRCVSVGNFGQNPDPCEW